jgi:shikimate dehydrogenase
VFQNGTQVDGEQASRYRWGMGSSRPRAAARPEMYAVTGRPILHSLSPSLFSAGFDALGMDAIYSRLAVDDAEEALRLTREIGLRGINVTSPLKERVLPLLDACDDAATHIGAVNAIAVRPEGTVGFNTDPVGVEAMWRSRLGSLRGKHVAILGAGGAACAAAFALRRGGAQDVVLINRTAERACRAAAALGTRAATWSEAPQEFEDADIIFSCLPTAVAPVDSSWLKPGKLILDANYKSPQLAEVARAGACEYGGGRSWLLGQAEAGFRALTGREPPREHMARAMAEATIPDRPRRIALAGMMGTGKTTVGKLLAQRLDVPFVDTDALVEGEAGMSVAEVFQRQGEPRFRQMEASAVARALAAPEAVVALGGGSLLRPETRRRVRAATCVVWLWATPAVAAARAHADRHSTRPLLAGEEPRQALRGLLDERLPTYARAADLVLDTGHRTAEQVAEKIADEIHQTWPR